MTPKEHLIESFRTLCDEHGVEVVATTTKSSPESFKQILSGVKLKSGEPRGVGPGVQRRLEKHYPGWARSPNVAEGPRIRGLIPLVSWIAAGQWSQVPDQPDAGDVERWLPCPVSHGPQTFALRVKGESMTAPYGSARSYPEGCIIFVDPDRDSPVNGARVVVRLEGSDEATFKIFKEEDGLRWLAPINPQHQPMWSAFTVIGTVIGKWEDE